MQYNVRVQMMLLNSSHVKLCSLTLPFLPPYVLSLFSFFLGDISPSLLRRVLVGNFEFQALRVSGDFLKFQCRPEASYSSFDLHD